MTDNHSTTNLTEHKRGQHLETEERGAIQYLKRPAYLIRTIARELNYSPSTVGYKLKRGTSLQLEVVNHLIHANEEPLFTVKQNLM